MKINPYLPPLPSSTGTASARPAPSSPVAPPRDAVREQRDAAARLTAAPLQQVAEAWRGQAQVAAADADPRGQRALRAYAAVAQSEQHEYVTRILGIDEFA